ncbi:MAG: hypothetical protein NVSMB27_08630 [Ktedonobacteraceae bacterium]
MQAIRAYNQPILDDFRAWLVQAGLSEKTARRHMSNIDLFSMYLVYYDPLKKLDEAHSGDVRMFLSYWAPRKVGWTSVTTVKIFLTSFKKFFQWMGETGCLSPQTVADVLTTLKEGREEFLARAAEF